MGGKKKTVSTQTYRPPGYIEDTARSAVGVANRIANQTYTPYTGERVAGLSANERQGMDMARDTAGAAQPYYQQAGALAERGTQQFKDANMADYMNPYIMNALDPAARKIREQGAAEATALDSRATSMDAFGGSRAALMRTGATEKTLQSVKDLYQQGLAQAYESGVNIWGAERANDLAGAGRFMEIGNAVNNANQTDISTLMATGATDRNIQQAMKDFDYQQFIENRDWDFRSLGALIGALEGTKGSYTTTTTTEQEKKGGNDLLKYVGVAAAIVGAFYTGGATLSAIPSIMGSGE